MRSQGVLLKGIRGPGRSTPRWIAPAAGIYCNKRPGSSDYSSAADYNRCLPVTDWKTIVEQHGQLVWATGWRLLGNSADAADCYQETFLEAVRVARREPVDNWTALLRHLATARALDLLRVRCRQQNRTEALVDPATLVSQAAGPGQEAEANELAERLRAALGQLPGDQAEVFCLSCVEQASYREIGERLELTTNAVGVLLHRARKRLRELLIPVDAGSTNDD
jgi:RNA polymerase sigma-70 factor, ECF subfamily